MEVEMKAKITNEQAQILFERSKRDRTRMLDKNWHDRYIFEETWVPKYRSDKYYSHGGEYVTKPDHVVRIRTEAWINTCDYSIEDIINGKAEPEKDQIETFLTVKQKKTEDGVETNDESETKCDASTLKTLEALLNATNFQVYFEKTKTSVYCYVIDRESRKTLHCEIVNVNGLGPYLEIETFTSKEPEDVNEGISVIKDFFKDILGITSFESRSWGELINEV